ncbi:MAG: hypothetical protein GY953_21465 [bacterium]|nr:hypothetical protein [bacterium]
MRAARTQRLAQLENPTAVEAWKRRFGNHYNSPAGRSQSIALPSQSELDQSGGSGGGYSIAVWPLARWLAHRWSDIINSGHTLHQNLRTAGWMPNRAGNTYRDSFGGGEDAITAGRLLFEQCATQYNVQISQLGNALVRSIYGSGRPGLETSAAAPLDAGQREDFANKVGAWGVLNDSSGPSPGSGCPADGLPYGSPSGIDDVENHKDRIAALREAADTVANQHQRERFGQMAGIRDRVGGPGPRMTRWF